MINIFTKELFGITNLYYKEIRNAVVNIYSIFKDKPKFIYFSHNQQLYLLYRNKEPIANLLSLNSQ